MGRANNVTASIGPKYLLLLRDDVIGHNIADSAQSHPQQVRDR